MIKLSSIKANLNNPRIIKNEKFEKLKRSIEEFPEMMELRPIVIDENNVIIGGNMRFRALQDLGKKEVPNNWIKKASELTEDQKKRFVITDNASFGEWEWSDLIQDWDFTELSDWGIDTPDIQGSNLQKINSGDENSEWVGLPEFIKQDKDHKIIISFDDEAGKEEFAKKNSLVFSAKLGKTWSTRVPFRGTMDTKNLAYE